MDEIHKLYNSRIILTSDADWDPHELRPPKCKSSEIRTARSTNLLEIESMKRNFNAMALLRVYSHMERDVVYLQDSGDSCYALRIGYHCRLV